MTCSQCGKEIQAEDERLLFREIVCWEPLWGRSRVTILKRPTGKVCCGPCFHLMRSRAPQTQSLF